MLLLRMLLSCVALWGKVPTPRGPPPELSLEAPTHPCMFCRSRGCEVPFPCFRVCCRSRAAVVDGFEHVGVLFRVYANLHRSDLCLDPSSRVKCFSSSSGGRVVLSACLHHHFQPITGFSRGRAQGVQGGGIGGGGRGGGAEEGAGGEARRVRG